MMPTTRIFLSQANEGSASPKIDLPLQHPFHPVSARAAIFAGSRDSVVYVNLAIVRGRR